MQCANGADGGQVVGRDDGGGQLFQGEEPLHGGASAVDAVIANFNQRFVAGETLALE